jgi:sugar phosphate isomerase/epimerase
MRNATNRRTFLKQSLHSGILLAGLGLPGLNPVVAVEPFDRRGSPRLLPGLAGYSFRNYFVDVGHARDEDIDPTNRITLFDFIDFCSAHGVGAELTSYYFPPDVTQEFLIQVKRHAFLRGVPISGTAVGNTFTLPKGKKRDEQIACVKKWIDYAQTLGTSHIRVFAGESGKLDRAGTFALFREAMEECCDYAGGKGISLGLENHGGIVTEADAVLDLVKAIKSPWFGINLDTGNFVTDDPYGDLARCAPYAVNVHWKTEIRKRGKGKEPADLVRLVQILRDAKYQGYITLEYEAAEDSWKAVPDALEKMRAFLDS